MPRGVGNGPWSGVDTWWLTGEAGSEELRLRVTNWAAFWLSLRLCVLILGKKKKKEMVIVLGVSMRVRITHRGSPRGEAWPSAPGTRSGDAGCSSLPPASLSSSSLDGARVLESPRPRGAPSSQVHRPAGPEHHVAKAFDETGIFSFLFF